MKVLVAVDSFKGSADSAEAAQAISEGLKEANGGVEVECVPVADGGEGTIEAVYHARGGVKREVETEDPLSRPVRSVFLLLPEEETAVVELAQASGLILLRPEERNPLKTTTVGTGRLIRAAVEAGAKRIVLAVGGSSTSDGGMGISQALGVRFRNREGRELFPSGESLAAVREIDTGNVPEAVSRVEFILATDVSNPLFGPDGAACVYAPQKGAGRKEVRLLDNGLRNLAEVLKQKTGKDAASPPGTGAAGGVGACLTGLFNTKITSGFRTLSALTKLEEKVGSSQIVITGEGKLDGQTLNGKAPLGVARMASKSGIPVFAVGGCITEDAEKLTEEGVYGFFPIVSGPMTLQESMAKAARLLRTTGRRIGYLLRLMEKQSSAPDNRTAQKR